MHRCDEVQLEITNKVDDQEMYARVDRGQIALKSLYILSVIPPQLPGEYSMAGRNDKRPETLGIETRQARLEHCSNGLNVILGGGKVVSGANCASRGQERHIPAPKGLSEVDPRLLWTLDCSMKYVSPVRAFQGERQRASQKA